MIKLVHLHFDSMTLLQNGYKTKNFCCTCTHFAHIFLHCLGLCTQEYAIIITVLQVNKTAHTLLQAIALKFLHTHFFTCYTYMHTYFHRNIGRPENRYRIQILVGYGIPLLFIILTGIVEATGPVCSKWRPRFNEQSCFFSGYYFIFQIFLGCTN